MAVFVPKFLRQLRDVLITNVQDEDVLSYDSGSGKWVNAAGGGGGGAPTNATYITQTANGSLSNEQALSDLSTGLLKVTTTTGVLSTASAGTDYAAASHAHAGEDITSGTVADARIASTIARDSEVTSAISALSSVYQAKDATLDTYAGIDPSANVQSVLSAADYAAIRTLLGLVIGTNVQAFDADLSTWAGLTPSAFFQTLVDDADAATARATMGVIASLFQSGGAQAIKLDDLAAPDDNTDLNASTSKHGLLPKLDNNSAHYLDGTGAWSTPAGGGGTNTRYINLPPGAATMPDGSSGNAAPALQRVQGTETNPKKHLLSLAFDGGGGTEHAWWTFVLPAGYSSGGSLDLLWYLNATSNAVKWQARVSAVTPDDADTPIEHAAAAAATVTTNVNTTEANRLTKSTISLTMDSAAGGDLISLAVLRDSGDAADTATQDALLVGAVFSYTSS